MNAAAPDDLEDHGDDLGPAAQARPSELVRIGGNLRGAGQRTATPVVARRMYDATFFDRLHRYGQLNDRQHSAGVRLHKLWLSAGLEPRTTARHMVLTEAVHDDGDEPASDGGEVELWDRDTCLRHHRALMRRLPAHSASMLDAACMWVPNGGPSAHPGVRWLATFQAALDLVADIWEIPKDA